MRSLTILLILTALLLSATISNCIYINDISDRLLSKIEALPSPDAKEACKIKIDDLIHFWEQNLDAVCLSVSYTVADRISEHSATLSACADCGDRFGYYVSLSLLRDAVGDLRRLESLSIGSLL